MLEEKINKYEDSHIENIEKKEEKNVSLLVHIDYPYSKTTI